MNVTESSINQIKQYLKDIEETTSQMEREEKEEIREFQAESIKKRIEFIQNQLKNLEE
ncbi:MAG: hypothetical protein ACOCV8_04785 [Spirochaetota bacterium]